LWPLLVAILAFLAFTLVHQIGFRSASERYVRVLKEAQDMGLVLGPGTPPPMLSPQVVTILGENSLPAGVAGQRGNSGALTAAMLEDLTRLAAKHRIEVLSTEQGSVTQLESSVLVRAQLKLRSSYNEFVGLLDDLARSRTLYSVDRFEIEQGEGGRQNLDLWVTQTILKQTAGPQ
jgi:hypothetical protein